MKHFMLLALLCLVPLAMGCGSSAGSNGNGSATKDGGGLDNDGGGTTDTGSKSGLIVAKAPSGFVGDFYFGSDLTCASANSCEASVTGSIKVEFKCPKHLFLPKFASSDPKKDTQIVWTAPGDWGLAPNGTYRDQDDATYQVETKLEGGVIKLYVYGLADHGVLVQGNQMHSGSKKAGSISDNLKTITLLGPTPEDTFILTLVE